MMSAPRLVALSSLVAALAAAAGGGCAEEAEAPLDRPPREIAPRTCFPPAGLDGSPGTIEDVVALLDGLPKPITVACLLETLDRPLRIEASSDTFSLQPAYGPNNPRIFVFSGDLVITIVPKGEGSEVVELGVLRGPMRSVKGEIAFPVTESLAPSAPYDRILDEGGGQTTCAFCHLGETRDLTVDSAEVYVSDVLHPLPRHLVDFEDVRHQFETCDPEAEPARCAVFDAIFGHGEVVHQPFAGG